MRSHVTHCKICHSKIETKENSFTLICLPDKHGLKVFNHFLKHHKKEAIEMQPDIRYLRFRVALAYIGWQTIDVILGLIFGAVKAICFPFWWVYENM